MVIDYAHSNASAILGRVLDRLGVEVVGLNAHSTERAALLATGDGEAAVESVRRVAATVGADLGVIFDPGAESISVLDEQGELVPDSTLLLLLLGLACRTSGPGRVVLPLHTTLHAERSAAGCGATVVRTKVSEAALMAEAAQPGTIFAGALEGRYIFPDFLPSPDAVYAFGKVLELVAVSNRPMSELRCTVPQAHLAHAEVTCPWHLKGLVMRMMIDDLKDEPISLVDGIKVSLGDQEWVQILPDAEDPAFHVYTEAADDDDADRLCGLYKARLETVVADHGRVAAQ